MKPQSEKELIFGKIVQMQDMLTEAKVLDKMMRRKALSGSLDNKLNDLIVSNGNKMSNLKKGIMDQLEFYKTADKTTPLAKELGIQDTK